MLQERLNTARRLRDDCLNIASLMKDDESARLIYLRRVVEFQELVVKARNAIVDAYPPCKACGRKVKTPCNDAEGYYGSGPWDGSCEEVIRGR